MSLNDISKLYAPQNVKDRNTPVGQALGHLYDAWQALESLEESLPDELPRWEAESLTTARTGARRAWLALSGLHQSLNARQRRRTGNDI